MGGKRKRGIKNESQVSDLGDWVDVFPFTEFKTVQSRSLWEAVAGNPEFGFEHCMSEISLMSKWELDTQDLNPKDRSGLEI